MLTREEIRRRKKELHLTNAELSRLSGVPLGTVQKILGSSTLSPRVDTLAALEKVLVGGQARQRRAPSTLNAEYSFSESISDKVVSNSSDVGGLPLIDGLDTTNISTVSENCIDFGAINRISPETPADYVHYSGYIHEDIKIPGCPPKKQGEYTLDDYMKIPEGVRVELIDGVLFNMASPTNLHALVAGLIFRFLGNQIESNQGECIPFIAPADVQLDEDDKTVVVPDIFLVCKKEKILKARTFGAPDLVIEILSPSNRAYYMELKERKYREAGVREYWIVDPERQKVIVRTFNPEDDNDTDIFLYGFQETVPVRVTDSQVQIDFKQIYEYVKFLYETPDY